MDREAGATVDIEQDITKNYIRRLQTPQRQRSSGDEQLHRIIEAMKSVLGIYAEKKGLKETEECFLHMKLLIESHLISQFSGENYTDPLLGYEY